MQQLTEFNEGGSHSENPLGGIPQGIAPNGQPNLVEQGETKLNSDNYIYSDTLKVDKEIATTFNLPKSSIGKTFADVSKIITKPNSRRENDSIEQKDIKRGLESLMEAQETFKQNQIQQKLQEISSLDPNALGSLMQSQQPQQIPTEQPMEQPMEELPQGFRQGGYMYGEGGGLNWTVSNPNNIPQPSTQFQYPASAKDAVIYPSYDAAQTALFKGESDATRTYYQNLENGLMGELVGNKDINNANFQDWGPEKSTSVVKDTMFKNVDDPKSINKDLEGTYINEYNNSQIPTNTFIPSNPPRYDFGGWLKDNKQGVLGGLQAAAGIGAMFIPGAQGLGANLIGGGIGNISKEVANDAQQLPVTVGPQSQSPNLPVGTIFANGGPLNNNPSEPNIDPITGIDLNLFSTYNLPKTNNNIPIVKTTNNNSFQNTEIPGVDNLESGTNLIPSTYFNKPQQPEFETDEEGNVIETFPHEEFDTESETQNTTTKDLTIDEYKTELARLQAELKNKNVNLDIKQKPWELALQGLPVAYNTARGLFEKPLQLNQGDYNVKSINAPKMNVDPQLAATREAYAGAVAGLKNNMPSQGAYLTNRSAIANSEAQAKRDIYAGKENADNQLQLQTDVQNAQLQAQNNQNKMAIAQFNAQAKEAKKQLLGAGLVQGSQIGRASVDTNLQKEMMKLIAPMYTDWLKTQKDK